MTAYNFYSNAEINKIGKQATATPGDTSTITVRRGICDTTKQNLDNTEIAQVVPIFAGEVVLDIWAFVATADATSNAALDLGFAGGAEGEANGVITTANHILHNEAFVPLYFAANNYVTLVPQNSVAVDAAVIEVCAIVTKAFSKI